MDPAIDPRVIGELRALGSRDFLVDLIDTFLEETARRLADLRTGLSAPGGDLVRKSAHTLKGSAGNMGAMTLSGLCRKLEETDRAGAGKLEPVVREIEAEFIRVRSALLAERER